MKSSVLLVVAALAMLSCAAPTTESITIAVGERLMKVINRHDKSVNMVTFDPTNTTKYVAYTVSPNGSKSFPISPQLQDIWISEDQVESRGSESLIEQHISPTGFIVYDVSLV